MSKNKDWWDFPYNPVKGCGQDPHCPYCYGCRMVKRFGYAERVAMKELSYVYDYPRFFPWDCKKNYDHLVDRIKSFQPTFFEYVLAQKLRKKPTVYFFSMSDPASWKQEWYEKIVEKIAGHMQHTFVVLTKHPEIYRKYTFPHNTLLGVTCVDNIDVNHFQYIWETGNISELGNILFISFEPVFEKIEMNIFITQLIDLAIVGPETGNRKNRIICKPDWLDPFFDLDIDVYMKNACAKVLNIPIDELRQEWPRR